MASPLFCERLSHDLGFDRQNRQVYVFRRDGTVLKVGWGDIFWTIHGHAVSTKEGVGMGHVMAEDHQGVFCPEQNHHC
jgi:hypothetical protein